MNNELYEQAKALYQEPLFDLIFKSHQVHRANHEPTDIQRCTLLSIKTGGCTEDCGYCPQSVHYKTDIKRENLMQVEEVRSAAKRAKEAGAQRFCMGAAWREAQDGRAFDRVLEMVKAVHAEGLEVCVTLGMLTEEQAQQLKEAGVHSYNHNLDTSREYYPKIISTRTYDDRLQTIGNVRKAGINVCSGGILGLGESMEDRCALIAELASLDPQPESVPLNLLVSVDGTPLENADAVDPLDLVRMIAIARILIPKSRVRLSAGRLHLSREAQTLAYFAGANSIHFGEKLLTTPNNDYQEDYALFEKLGACQKSTCGNEDATTAATTSACS